ncbi:fibronectin type III domain-containing protein [Galbibacter sp. BG1]|uniref:fibronectin type III domain-containing protein n=1 Tax=Galbibacter sp. BG1 TaxID=1170699 RepID=UPI0015BBE557|nr:fibronectin type III domain-containing protein [Galbibacter sp. BG1]QLE00393.1 fibronectin type III domain-containing protein [Galbibacter sp. BG1]
MKKNLLLVLCLLLSLVGGAQTFPVTVAPQVKQPAPIYFSSYADASLINGPLQVQIVLNDLNIANREVRLKTYFEGNGISFQSNNVVSGATPLFLEGGIPLVLTNVELAPYFQYPNITGISAMAYGQPIPEGSYQFCFEVYDVASGNRISQKSCATTYIFQNEPPFLVFPQNRKAIQQQNPQNIVFQWTPRQINVTNAEYELSIVEVWDNVVDPQAAFLSSPPVFTVTTNKTSYLYGPTDPMLLDNKRYAWRVRAKAKQGDEEIGLFKNQGYSEIFFFVNATPCTTPINVTHEVKGMREANIYWDDFSTDITEFTVRYREKGENNQWFTSRSTANWVTLWDLRPGTVYEYQVAKECQLVTSDYSPVKTLTTFIANDEAGLYNCGIPSQIDLDNQTPLNELKKGDVFKAGDFPVKVREVSGSNGRFTGKGYVTIPYLNSVKVAVEFTNVFVNTDNQLAEGMVITKYDPSMKNILDVDQAIDDVADAVEAVGDLAGSVKEVVTELLNLDIDKTTRANIDALAQAMGENIDNESIPKEIKQQMEEAVTQMAEAKTKYDNAITSGDTQGAENATNDFNAAQSSLNEANKKLDDVKEEFVDLLKKAITELYREGRDDEEAMNTLYQEIYNNITEDYAVEDKDFYLVESVEMQEVIKTESDNTLQKELNEIEIRIGVYLFAKVLSTEETSGEKMTSLIKQSKAIGVDLFKEINTRLENGDTNRSVIDYLKGELRTVFASILVKNAV